MPSQMNMENPETFVAQFLISVDESQDYQIVCKYFNIVLPTITYDFFHKISFLIAKFFICFIVILHFQFLQY